MSARRGRVGEDGPPPRFARLRWQLTFCNLKVVALTVALMIAFEQVVVTWWLHTQDQPVEEAARDARTIAGMVGGVAARSDAAATDELGVMLRAIGRGELRPGRGGQAPWQRGEWGDAGNASESWGPPWMATGLSGVAYVVATGADGRPRASSAPEGAAFAPAERSEWDAPIRRALGGERDTERLVSVRGSAAGPGVLGAYPVFDAAQRPVGAVLVAKRSPPAAQSARSVWQTLIAVGAATTALVLIAAPFALPPAVWFAYLLARRLVRRLERMGSAAEALAAGNLTQRVEEGRPDEVGQLARRFNRMADRLEKSVGELEGARASAEAALTAKRDLVANVSHELRTPLALIRGHVESLLMESGASDRDEYLAVIQRETEQLSRLIDDLFALSTTETGALPLAIERVDVGELVSEVVNGVAPVAWRERQVTVVAEGVDGGEAAGADGSERPGSRVLADRQRLAQILGNLVRNALRHTPEGGLIAVRVERRGDAAALVVEDTGEGIPSDELPRVFERFYRGGDGRDRAGGGAGLGLAIVKELVEAMGGRVSVESEPGRGSRFSVILSLAPQEDAEDKEFAVSSQTGHGAAAGT